MNIIGRSKEKAVLQEAFKSVDAELIAVYGRRRVGKTYLIKNYFLQQKCVFFQTTGIYKGTLKKQLEQFTNEVSETFYRGAFLKKPATWMEAFEALNHAMEQIPKNKKIVMFFDELPWMATRKSGLVQAVEYYWNRHWGHRSQIKLILCGSAASWIIKNIIKNRGGLHNRITRKIRLMPFNLQETFLYVQHRKYSCNYKQITKIYMVTGGVPFYVKQFKNNLSIDQNINSLFFDSNGIFFNEFDEIFSSLFDDSEQYKEIIKLIANVKEGINRSVLEQKNKLTGIGGRLTHRLENLEHAGFISTYTPYKHKKRGVFYRISDEYSYFYLRWIDPIKNELKQNPTTNFWLGIVNTPAYFGWMGYAFENICYKHLAQIRKALKLNDASLASGWRTSVGKGEKEQGAQIDLLFDRNDDAITICEIKYTDNPFVINKSYANILENKIKSFVRVANIKKQIFLAIISSEGLKESMYSKELVQDIVLLEDLFVP